MAGGEEALAQQQVPVEGAKQTALKLAARMFSASVIGMIMSVPIKLVNAAVLDLGGYGLIRIADLVGQYASYADLGLRYSLTRQVPLALGRGDEHEAEVIKRVVFAWTWLISVAAVIVLSVLFAFGFNFKGLLNLPNLTLVSLMLVVDRFNAYLHSLAKSHGQFEVVGQNALALAVLTPLIMLPAVVLLHVTGVLLGQLLLKLFVTAYYIRYLSGVVIVFPRLSLPVAKIVELSKIGLLLWAINLSETLYWTIDLTLVAFFLEAEDVGLFGFGLGLLGLAVNIASPFNMVAYRRMLVERGDQSAHQDPSIFRRYLETPFVAFLLVVSIALGFTYFGYEYMVRQFVPRFLPAMPVVKVIIFGHMLFATTYFTGIIFSVADQLTERLRIIWLGLALNTVLDLVLISRGYGILGAAWGSTISYCLYASVFLVSCTKMVYGTCRIGLALLARLVFASVVLALGIHMLDQWQITAILGREAIIMQMVVGVAFAGLKMLLYSFAAMLLYVLLFGSYRPVHEIMLAIRYLIGHFRDAVRQRLAVT